MNDCIYCGKGLILANKFQDGICRTCAREHSLEGLNKEEAATHVEGIIAKQKEDNVFTNKVLTQQELFIAKKERLIKEKDRGITEEEEAALASILITTEPTKNFVISNRLGVVASHVSGDRNGDFSNLTEVAFLKLKVRARDLGANAVIAASCSHVATSTKVLRERGLIFDDWDYDGFSAAVAYGTAVIVEDLE